MPDFFFLGPDTSLDSIFVLCYVVVFVLVYVNKWNQGGVEGRKFGGNLRVKWEDEKSMWLLEVEEGEGES